MRCRTHDGEFEREAGSASELSQRISNPGEFFRRLSRSPHQLGRERTKRSIVRIGHVVIRLEKLLQPFVGAPLHPFRFRRKLPVAGIKVDQMGRSALLFRYFRARTNG
jgi:hypothetical protein